MVKKRKSKIFSKKTSDLDKIIKDVNKGFLKNFKFVNKHIDTLKRTFTKYEEPYSEIRQSHRGMNIKIKLPKVKQRNIKLNVTDSQIEIKAETKIKADNKKVLKIYHRTIDIPKCSIPKQTIAKFNNQILKIKVPYIKVR
jgi:HSP20 family molecular chaperone IbpA